jgi:Alr-MurF fusion protein
VKYTLSEIAEACKALQVHIADPDQIITSLLTDSRNVTHTQGVMFVALSGERHDGHLYIRDLHAKGIRNFLICSNADVRISAFSDSSFIVVNDSLEALQMLAAQHRNKFRFPLVAITGSNGKTIVKEWLWQLLSSEFNIVRSPKSYNSQTGVPLSLMLMEPFHNLGIFEAGISRAGEMSKLHRMLQPDIVLFTNIGPAHDENFTSRSEKAKEKSQLANGAGRIVFSKDDAEFHSLLGTSDNKFVWSRKTNADLLVTKITKDKHHTAIQAVFANAFHNITIPFTDEASVENAIHCLACLCVLEKTDDRILQRFTHLTPVAMRLELKAGVNNCSVINDSYNSDLGSLSVALDFLNQQQQHPKRTVILSDILQSGRDEADLYTEVSGLMKAKGISRFIGIGDALLRQQSQFSQMETEFYNSTADFIRQFVPSRFHNETILLKGARSFEFENISKLLQQKSHETVMEIDLSAMVHNLNYVRSRLNPGTKLMVMVKAFSYGSGTFEIANLLQFHRVNYLAVAYADEGLELRKSGITLPIMVMNPEEQSFDSMIANALEPEIYSFRILQLFESAARRFRQSNALTEPVSVHIKFDTGMRRLGFSEQELNELVVRLNNSKDLRVASVFSHLAASDESEHDEFTRQQIRTFTSICERMREHVHYPFLRHILNSSGILRFPDAQMEMVRLGIGLYGISGSEEQQKHFRNVSTLRTTISQLRNAEPGTTIGYSRKGKAENNMTIATVPIGYADGLSRVLSGGKGKMYVNGQPAPIVGNVCMDMCMIDVTGIQCKEGDDVIVFDSIETVCQLAADMNTIPYEVLTSVSPRVKRIYWQE